MKEFNKKEYDEFIRITTNIAKGSKILKKNDDIEDFISYAKMRYLRRGKVLNINFLLIDFYREYYISGFHYKVNDFRLSNTIHQNFETDKVIEDFEDQLINHIDLQNILKKFKLSKMEKKFIERLINNKELAENNIERVRLNQLMKKLEKKCNH